MTNISNLKKLIKQSNKEITEVTTAINRSNSKIDKNVINTYINFPFEEIQTNDIVNLTLKEDIKKDINGKFTNGMTDGQSLLLSLLSINSINKNQRNHIISVEIENLEVINYYINTLYLEEDLNMTKLFIDKLNTTIKLSESINLLIEMFINRTDSYYQKRYAKDDYTTFSLSNKIKLLQDILTTIYGSLQTYDIDNLYYLFKIDDINIKSNVLKYVKNNNSINLNLFKFYQSKLEEKELKVGNSIVNFNDSLKSLSQTNAINSLDKQIVNIIGAAGSGKTYLASRIMNKYVELSLLNNINFPFLYTTYSKYSLEQFLKYSEEYKDLIFINNETHLKNKAMQLSKEFDMEKFNTIKTKINEYKTKIDLEEINSRFNELILKKENLNKAYSKTIDSDTMAYIKKYCETLKINYVKPNFINSLLYKFNFKQPENYVVPNTILNPLKNNGITLPQKVNELDMLETSEKVRNSYHNNEMKIQNYFKNLDLNYSTKEPIIFEFEHNLTVEEIVYYLTYRCIAKNPANKHTYIQAINNYLEKKNTNIKVLQEVFPIWTGLVTNIVDYDIDFKQVVIDESVLVPAYFFSIIANRSESMIAMGDVNQLSLNQSFYPNIQHIVNKIYGEKGYLSLSCKSNFEQQSFFDHITDIVSKDKTLVLTDNFRCNSKIFELSKFIGGDQYNDYFQRYINKNNLTLSVNDITKHYNLDEDKKFTSNNEIIDTPFLFIDNREDKYDKLKSFIKENKINNEDVMIIVPFSYNIQKVRTLLGDGIMVDVIENVQGIEKKIVVFDWNFINTHDDNFKYIDKRKFNLMITRAKNIFITIADKEYCFHSDIEQTRMDNGYIILNRFIRNSSKFKIFEI